MCTMQWGTERCARPTRDRRRRGVWRGRTGGMSQCSTTVYSDDEFGQLAAEYGQAGAVGGTSYRTADMLGSTRVETPVNPTAANGTIYDYLPFGGEIGAGTAGRDSTFS